MGCVLFFSLTQGISYNFLTQQHIKVYLPYNMFLKIRQKPDRGITCVFEGGQKVLLEW